MSLADVRDLRQLGAVLLNPPLTTGAVTMRHLQVAAEVLGCDGVRVANLFATPTRSVTQINDVGRDSAGWTEARPALARLGATSAELVAAWGVSGLHGPAFAHWQAQITWLIHQFRQDAVAGVWTLNGEPRHPSRWHQYVSDRHGRASGATFRDRLSSVLRWVELGSDGHRPGWSASGTGLLTLSVRLGGTAPCNSVGR